MRGNFSPMQAATASPRPGYQRCVFSLSKCATSITPQRKHFHRVGDLSRKLRPRVAKKIQKRAPPQTRGCMSGLVAESKDESGGAPRSILDMLRVRKCQRSRSPRHATSPESAQLESGAQSASSPANPVKMINAEEAWNLTVRPSIFVWAPEKLETGLRIRCPGCGKNTSEASWAPGYRTLHGVNGQFAYVTTIHVCHHCNTAGRRTGTIKKDRGRRKMNDDSSDVRATLPDHIASMWKFVDTGRVLCDSAVMDMVRALATKTSWNGIADTINEMKATAWVRDVVHRYFQVCASLGIPPQTIPVDLPKLYRLSNDWVKTVYVSDMEKRRVEITRELEAEKATTFSYLIGRRTRLRDARGHGC